MHFGMNLSYLVSIWHQSAYATLRFRRPKDEKLETMSALIDSAAGVRSCPRSEAYAGCCSRNCRTHASLGWERSRKPGPRMDPGRRTPHPLRSFRVRTCTGSNAWTPGLFVQL